MTTRNRFERGARLSRFEMEKRQEERFVKNLESARDALDSIIDDITMGDTSDVMDALESVGEKLDRVHRQAERMEGER